MVKAASTEFEKSVCMKSLETSGCVSKLIMPFMGPSAAAFTAAFTSSLLHFLLTFTTRSTTETFGVGTGTTQVPVAPVEDHLVAGVRMRGGHHPIFDTEALIEDLAHRRHPVGRAGGIGNHGVILCIV